VLPSLAGTLYVQRRGEIVALDLAVVYCPEGCPYSETGPAEVRLIEAQTGAISGPLWNGADTLGGLEWRP
jgi:hypothetical protein